ncbi:hypothetical protein MSPP1_003381 [Malassezia sp. CBS 17886]|nr:hypothetical protein MSPP1_003381 [Malassezia sp. CBS 17886]
MQFEAVPCFAHDDAPATRDSPQLFPHFGLRPGTSWRDVLDKVAEYKLVYLARHGQGYHNLAEEKRQYGTRDWENYWAQRTGDGAMYWGPDPRLTPLGADQAAAVHHAWTRARAEEGDSQPPPLPEVLCSSPLTRCLDTLYITWRGVLLEDVACGAAAGPRHPPRSSRSVHVRENLREVLGKHTCDRRSTKSGIARRFPLQRRDGAPAPLVFHAPFSEEDVLWRQPDWRESDDAMRERIRRALESIWRDEARGKHGAHICRRALMPVVCITCHGGVMQRVLELTSHVPLHPAVGGAHGVRSR